MPGDGGAGCNSPELVYDVAGNEVNVVVTETEVRVADPVSPQLVQLGLLHPLPTLHTAQDRLTSQHTLTPCSGTWDMGGS